MANTRRLLHAIGKETRVIVRDRQALAILFVMPVVFVVIMSLALRDAFSERAGVTFPLLIVNHDGGFVGDTLAEHFADNKSFAVQSAAAPFPDEPAITRGLLAGRYRFAIVIPPDTTGEARGRARAQLASTTDPGETDALIIRLLADPTVRADHQSMVAATLNGLLRGIEARLMADELAARLRDPRGRPMVSAARLAAPEVFAEVKVDAGAAATPMPTSVQQNAPAWTLLAMFFLAIPLSVTFIKERQQGTYTRLQTMPVPGWVLLGGKIAPYFVINQLQVVIILVVSVYALPLLGGDRLDIGDAPLALALLSAAASLAAIGFALVIATLARTPEQATTFSATSVLILAALGGILVPKLVMPPLMQRLADLSPLSWGLDGFLDVFVRGGGVAEVFPESVQLLVFSLACLTIGAMRFRYQLRHN